jgi:sugar/nucleoside kinase (ribokinase family)
MSAFDVVTIGSATQDVFLKSTAFEEIRNPLAPDGFDACIPLGAKVDLDDIFFTHGGGAMNAAMTFAHFGLKTACLARIGRDAVGESIQNTLKKNHISTQGIQVDAKEKSAYSLALLAGSGHRAILTHRGAAARIDPKKIPWKKLSAPWLYLTSLGGQVTSLERIFRQAEKDRRRVFWNPGTHELELGLKKLDRWLTHTSILSLNREEAALLTNLPPRQTEKILTALFHLPPAIILLTDGHRGAYLLAHGKAIFAPALPLKQVNTTGAGDAFGSAFLATMLQEKNPSDIHALEKSLKSAVLNAASVISHMGAQTGILSKKPGLIALRHVHLKQTSL